MILIIDILTVLLRVLPFFLSTWRESLLIKGECGICLDALNNNTKKTIKTKECGHTFHADCLNQWITKNPSCPYCRTKLKTKRVLLF